MNLTLKEAIKIDKSVKFSNYRTSYINITDYMEFAH
jgi:hypothetical protein